MSTPSKPTEINAFSGGMNNVTAPYLIRLDESALLINVDLRRGALQSSPEKTFHSDVKSTHFFQYNKGIYNYTSFRSNVIWDRNWYWSDQLNTGKMYPDGTERPLGLPTPTTRPTAVLVGVAGDGVLFGDLKYCYTFYDSEYGTESAPSPLSPYVPADEQNITIDNFEPLPEYADSYRVYRIGGYLPFFSLVEKIEATQLPYTDNKDDTQIDGTILQTIRNGPPPPGLHFLTEMNGRMFGAVDNKVYYSALGNPDSWYVFDFIPVINDVLSIAKTPGGLLIIGDGWTNVLRGNDPLNFHSSVISDNVGTTDIASLAYIDTNAIWLSRHGVVMCDGYTVRQLTSDRIENIQGMYPLGATVVNQIYYMAFKPALVPEEWLYPEDTLYPSGSTGTAGIDQGIMSLDFKRGQTYAYKTYGFYGVEYLDTIDGNVAISEPLTPEEGTEYAFLCDEVAFPDCDEHISCNAWEIAYIDLISKEQLDNLNHLANLTYISPALVDGSTTTLKQYDKVRVLFKGSFKFTIMFDNERVIVERDIITDPYAEFEEAIFGIPNKDNLSYSIRFMVEGQGIINGIQYTVKGRELP